MRDPPQSDAEDGADRDDKPAYRAVLENRVRARSRGQCRAGTIGAPGEEACYSGIRQIRTALRAPTMNAFAERLIGTLRPERFDHVIVLNQRHAQRLLAEFRDWYNQDRVHLALCKGAPDHRAIEPPELGKVVVLPRLGGLHHRYSRRAA